MKALNTVPTGIAINGFNFYCLYVQRVHPICVFKNGSTEFQQTTLTSKRQVFGFSHCLKVKKMNLCREKIVSSIL